MTETADTATQVDAKGFSAVPGWVIREASRFALCDDEESTRWPLFGVYVHTVKGCGRVTASNGGQAAIFNVPGAVIAQTFLVEMRDGKKLLKILKKEISDTWESEEAIRWLVIDHETGTVHVVVAEIAEDAIVGAQRQTTDSGHKAALTGYLMNAVKYPDLSQFITGKTFSNAFPGECFDARLLRRFARLSSPWNRCELTLYATEPERHGPYIVRLTGRPDFLGLLMPLTSEKNPLPDWWNAEEES